MVTAFDYLSRYPNTGTPIISRRNTRTPWLIDYSKRYTWRRNVPLLIAQAVYTLSQFEVHKIRNSVYCVRADLIRRQMLPIIVYLNTSPTTTIINLPLTPYNNPRILHSSRPTRNVSIINIHHYKYIARYVPNNQNIIYYSNKFSVKLNDVENIHWSQSCQLQQNHNLQSKTKLNFAPV